MRLFFSVVVGGCLLFGGWFLCFVWVCCFGSGFVYELSHSLLFTQKLWRFQVSVKGHWTYSWAYVWVRRVSLRLFYLDCRYPRDQMQPARKKKRVRPLDGSPKVPSVQSLVTQNGSCRLLGKFNSELRGCASSWGLWIFSRKRCERVLLKNGSLLDHQPLTTARW